MVTFSSSFDEFQQRGNTLIITSKRSTSESFAIGQSKTFSDREKKTTRPLFTQLSKKKKKIDPLVYVFFVSI